MTEQSGTGVDPAPSGAAQPEKVTIRDVARHAGVSYQTVSRAINDGYGISPATKAHVLSTALTLGFVPNTLARGLATNKTSTIGLAVPTLVNPFFAELAQATIDAATEVGHTVVVLSAPLTPDGERAALASLTARALDGVVGFFGRTTDASLRAFAAHGPLVLINREVEDIESVSVDVAQGMHLLIDRVASAGHTRVGFLDGSPDWEPADQRRASFEVRARQLGWPEDPSWRPQASNDSVGGQLAMARLIEEHPDVSAVIAYNDAMAMGAMAVLAAHDIRVPEHISVAGFDGIVGARMVAPALTTVATDFQALGRYAVEAALRASNRPSGTTGPPLHLRLPMTLIPGASVTRAVQPS